MNDFTKSRIEICRPIVSIFTVGIPSLLVIRADPPYGFSKCDLRPFGKSSGQSAGAVGNLVSNGAEEVIYRGILLAAVLSVFKRNWLSILIPAVAFGLGHWDYPVVFQLYIALIGVALGALYLRTKSLLAPYTAHMIADLLADSFFH